MKAQAVILTFLINLMVYGQSAPVEDCTQMTGIIFRNISPVLAGTGNRRRFVGREVEIISENIRRGCVNFSQLPDHFPRYFSTETGAPESFIQRRLDQYWEDKFNYLEEIRRRGPLSSFEGEYRALQELYNEAGEFRPSSFPSQESFEAIPKAPCGNVDVSSEMPPIRNQGSSGWCNYFAFSDLLSFHTGKNISAAYLGHILSPSGGGGSGEISFNDVLDNHGVCLEETYPSTINPSGFSQQLEELNGLISSANQGPENLELFCSRVEEISSMLPGLTVSEILSISASLTSESGGVFGPRILDYQFSDSRGYKRNTYISGLVYELCAEDRRETRNLTDLRFNGLSRRGLDGSRNDLIGKINSTLNNNKPIAISYEYTGLEEETEGGAHVSTIVGRREVNGSCQYLVRNSWGPTSCTRVVNESDACSPAGHFWVDSSRLVQYLNSVTVME